MCLVVTPAPCCCAGDQVCAHCAARRRQWAGCAHPTPGNFIFEGLLSRTVLAREPLPAARTSPRAPAALLTCAHAQAPSPFSGAPGVCRLPQTPALRLRRTAVRAQAARSRCTRCSSGRRAWACAARPWPPTACSGSTAPAWCTARPRPRSAGPRAACDAAGRSARARP